MRHLDLFSGIGGFAYAADQVFGDVEHIFCDNNKFCQAVLKKHWPGSEVLNDIKTITNPRSLRWRQGICKSEDREQKEGFGRGGQLTVNILTGGFPCQPFSAAGARRGTADDRYLWPEMLRIIRLAEPEWVIAENVRGLTTWNDGMVLETVCSNLEASGYEVQPFIIPALAVNAPHRRDRIWFVAHACGDRRQRRGSRATAQEGLSERSKLGGQLQGRSERQDSWNRDWPEVAAELCSVDDGLPVELDGFKLTKAQHRKEQLKAYGNAIVPQVAMEIMKAIKETM